jgi:oxygen-independent coproporphyrinogen-3 oxidase
MVIITKKREVAEHYLEFLEREVAMLAAALNGRRRVVQYHWGGGTPSYLSPAQMTRLHATVASHFDIDPAGELAIEIDPRVTTREHLETLRRLGFNRLSLGIQDFTPEVQAAVNRLQSEEETRAQIAWARQAGFQSVNVDLIYGLPRQTPDSFVRTIDAVVAIRPERIAAYSFAHVPWIRGNQKRIDPADLPAPEVKLQLFLSAADRFLAAGYRQIGMDHFALPEDELARAAAAGTLHRNFMGYTTRPATDMIGAGVSAIGDVDGAFSQNTKKLSTYYAALGADRFPIERGFVLDADDHIRRHVITQIMCNFRVDAGDLRHRFGIEFGRYFAAERAEIEAGPAADDLVVFEQGGLRVTPRGHSFVRNICMSFDRYLKKASSTRPVFSRTI